MRGEPGETRETREKRGVMLRTDSYDRWGGDAGPEGGVPWRKIIVGLAIAAGAGLLAVIIFIIVALQGLPSLDDLQDYQPPVTSRVHAGDGALVAEFAREQRVFVPIEAIPDNVKNAFIATEDARFFEHSGIDYAGLARAIVSNVYSRKSAYSFSPVARNKLIRYAGA